LRPCALYVCLCLLLPFAHPRRVVLLGDSHTGVAEENRDPFKLVTPLRNRRVETEWNSSLASTLTLQGTDRHFIENAITTRSAQSPLRLDRVEDCILKRWTLPKIRVTDPVLMNRYQLGSRKVFSWATDLHGSYNGRATSFHESEERQLCRRNHSKYSLLAALTSPPEWENGVESRRKKNMHCPVSRTLWRSITSFLEARYGRRSLSHKSISLNHS
jgi:hypothetical protein